MQILIALNGPPYGTQRCYKGLCRAFTLGKSKPQIFPREMSRTGVMSNQWSGS